MLGLFAFLLQFDELSFGRGLSTLSGSWYETVVWVSVLVFAWVLVLSFCTGLMLHIDQVIGIFSGLSHLILVCVFRLACGSCPRWCNG